MEEEKKKGVVEKSGEELGKVANKGVGVVKGFGKGLVKGFKNKDEKSEEEKKE
ncbi:MAG: hypothetical protein M1526_03995 [Candidatus Thermoplasmatota archaeon]|jgi:hypothetical protein|nr:hypothetical protein [Candidatus Thermoplasmatota archaeon]MCW6158440.1 hypothetical protein [Thermoplasmatales archaeon]